MEQVNPNALGAPAEGFGQTVSFAFDPRGEVPQQTMQQATRGNSGNSGGSGINAHAMNPNAAIQPVRQDPTTALLMRVGDAILKPALDKQRTAEYVSGMQQAMAGEALTDIVEQVPWYAKLFGDTPAIEGARAYTAHAKVNAVMADQVASMGNLEALSGPDAAKHFTKVVNSSLTGDAGADSVIMKGLSDQLPGLMKAQAKAHYGYNQRRAMLAYGDNMLTGANTLQGMGQMLADGTVGPGDMAKANAAFVQSVVPPEGLDAKGGGEAITAAMLRMAQSGQFHAIVALKESGSYMALDDKQVVQVEAAVAAAANKHRNAYSLTFAADIGALRSNARHPAEGMTPDVIKQQALGMNAKYQQMTGSPLGLFNSDEVADMMAGTFDAIKAQTLRVETARQVQADRQEDRQYRRDERAADKADKARTKELAALAEKQELTHLLAKGGIVHAQANWPKASVNEAISDLMVQNPKQAPALLMTSWINGGYVHEETQQAMQALLRQSGGRDTPPDSWFAAVSLYNTMKASDGGIGYAAAYFGDADAKRLHRASVMLGENLTDNANSAGIYRATAPGSDERRPVPLSKDSMKALAKSVTGINSGIVMRTLTGSTNLNPSALALVGDLTQSYAEEWRATGATDAEAIKMGLTNALQSGKLEVVGGYAIQNADFREGGAPPATLRALASTPDHPIGSDSVDGYFKSFLESKGVTEGDTRLIRMGKQGGATRYAVTVTKDGVTSTRQFNSDEWRDYARSHDTVETTARKASVLTSPSTYPGHAPKAPSIYDHAAKGRAEALQSLLGMFTSSTPEQRGAAAAAAKQPK